jgi:hypothetical protein
VAKVNLTRIIAEDFPEKYQDLLSKLLYKINASTEETSNALNNGLTVADNLSGQETELTVTAPVSSTNPIYFKSNLKGNCRMIICGSAQTISGTPPTGTPFFTFEMSGANIKVTNITNLTSGSRYLLRIYCLT